MRSLITLAIVLFCLQLWAQVPDTTSVAPGRLIIKVNQAFQTIGTRSDGIIDPEPGKHYPVFTQTRMHKDAIEFGVDRIQALTFLRY